LAHAQGQLATLQALQSPSAVQELLTALGQGASLQQILQSAQLLARSQRALGDRVWSTVRATLAPAQLSRLFAWIEQFGAVCISMHA